MFATLTGYSNNIEITNKYDISGFPLHRENFWKVIPDKEKTGNFKILEKHRENTENFEIEREKFNIKKIIKNCCWWSDI